MARDSPITCALNSARNGGPDWADLQAMRNRAPHLRPRFGVVFQRRTPAFEINRAMSRSVRSQHIRCPGLPDVNRMLLVTRACICANECHEYRPPFGLHQ